MSAHEQALAPATSVGRFTLRRVLGQGAQATVWLAHDPRLDREVAVKLMRPDAESASAGPTATQWLQEARSVSRLNHPNIVPVFEADLHGAQPYLVFEYVEGRTLAETLRARSTPPGAREAASMMIGVLDALQAAHAAGVVHRDLKPSNILVDAGGRARVMDFGIAARSAGAGGKGSAGMHPIVGTPGYMSPEAARGEPPSPLMDVFSAGLMLIEMLSGQRLIAERDPYRAIHRAATEEVALPAALPGEVDTQLRALLQRAIARDGAQRLQSAAAFRDGLHAWLTPPADASGQPGGGASGALDFLLRKMRHKSDFPALTDAVARIQRVANSERESVASLSAAILDDVALTNKLLRMVNTAHYAQAGGGSVSTISRAVSLVGFTGIRNMALSLVLLEHMHDKLHANHLKAEFLRGLFAGTIASELARTHAEGEEAFIGALFQNLGRLLTKFYFPEEARQVEQATTERMPPLTEEAASIQALGMSYEDLGLGVARSWGLPDTLLRAMRIPRAEPPATAPVRAADRLRWVTLAANDAAQALMIAEPVRSAAAMVAVAERYARSLGVSAKDMQASAAKAREHLADLARAMGLPLPASLVAQPALEAPAGQDTATVVVAAAAGRPLASPADAGLPEAGLSSAGGGPGAAQPRERSDALDLTLPLDPPAGLDPPPQGRAQAASMMAAGIQDITNAMVESFKLKDVLHMILETMLRALGLRRVVFCLRDPRSDVISGRFGLGEDATALVPRFRVAASGGSDLFAIVCAKAADTLISDASAPHIAARLPAWFTQHVAAPAFLLLPLAIKGAPFALIYADMARAGGIVLDDKELALLRTLRNQAVMAFRQQG